MKGIIRVDSLHYQGVVYYKYLGENFASITKVECMAKWMEEQRLNGLSEILNSE